MENIIQLLESSLENLKKRNITVTPKSFEREFYSLLDENDLMLEEHQEFKFIVDSLDDSERKSFLEDKTTSNLSKILSKRISNHEVKTFLKHLSYFISSSISEFSKDELEHLFVNIASNPHSLITDDVIRALRKYTDERKEADKKLFNEKSSDVKELIEFLSRYLKSIISENKTSEDELSKIKDDLNNLRLSSSSSSEIKRLQEEMLSLTDKIQTSLKNNEENIIKNQNKCLDLYEQIESLQYSLNKAEEEKSIDFLTGALTRRAYVKEFEKIENEYNIFDSDYAIVFYDIDHFKKINDNFGHDCGDNILAKFATILNKLTRTGDIISRYGGEEFVALVHYSDEVEAKNYLKRIKNIISNNKFVYKDNKIDVRFCAGVSYRRKYEDKKEAMKKADKLLYEAKSAGRNLIMFDDNEII